MNWEIETWFLSSHGGLTESENLSISNCIFNGWFVLLKIEIDGSGERQQQLFESKAEVHHWASAWWDHNCFVEEADQRGQQQRQIFFSTHSRGSQSSGCAGEIHYINSIAFLSHCTAGLLLLVVLLNWLRLRYLLITYYLVFALELFSIINPSDQTSSNDLFLCRTVELDYIVINFFWV